MGTFCLKKNYWLTSEDTEQPHISDMILTMSETSDDIYITTTA